jgi:hypothetical protein
MLLTGAVDYAGLFSPSQLSMSEAVTNYALNRSGLQSWMLGRFVLPVARLDEFLEAARQYISQKDKKGWRLSVLAGENIYETLSQIDEFNKKNGPAILCDSLEVRASTVSKIENTAASLPEGLTAYFEIVQNEKFVDLVSALGIRRQRAKIRTGGVTADAFPTSKEIVRFVRTCMAANGPFKATAGLHHPMRCFRPLTYEPDAPKGSMHGFLNLFLMTGFARDSFRPKKLEQIMEEEFEEVFLFEPNGVRWRDDFLNLSKIESLRADGIVSFGSCSFDEPLEDLKGLGLL